MLWTIFVILLVLWLLGVVSSYTIGGFIHLLLVLALVVLLINIIGGRRTGILGKTQTVCPARRPATNAAFCASAVRASTIVDVRRRGKRLNNSPYWIQI